MLIIGFFRIEADRTVMPDAELTGTESLEAGDHGEVVRVASDIGARLPKPECRLDDCDNASPGHGYVVVCRARYHVGVRIDDNARMLISGRTVRPVVWLIFPNRCEALHVGEQTRELLGGQRAIATGTIDRPACHQLLKRTCVAGERPKRR